MTNLPPGWTEAALGDVCEVNPKPGSMPGVDDEVAFLGMSSVHTDGTTDEGELRRFLDVSKGYTQFERGDVLVAKITPCFENGKIAQADPLTPVAAGSTEFHVVRACEDVEARYVLHYLRHPRVRMAGERRMTGSGGQRRVPTSFLAELRLPLPPLEEQRRIAAILDKADELRAKRRRARSHLADLQGSLFKAMFGRAVDNGSGRVLGDLIEIQIGPFGSLLHQSDYVVGGVPLVNPMHLVDGRIVPRSRETVAPEAVERLGRYVLREGDVVLGRRGDMGRCAVVGPAEAGFICGSGSMILRPHSDNVRPRFLAAALSSLEARDELARRAKGVTMLNLNSDAVASVRLVCPPLDEQIRFERASHEVDLRAKAQVRSEEDLDSLFASLQSRAFRGEL